MNYGEDIYKNVELKPVYYTSTMKNKSIIWDKNWKYTRITRKCDIWVEIHLLNKTGVQKASHWILYTDMDVYFQMS